MSLLKFGAYQKHAVSPWATGPPSDAKCSVCLMVINETDDIEWAPCGHFAHKGCFARLSTCPDCRTPLGHDALVVVDANDADMQEAEEARYMERIREDVERARSDVSIWNMFTDEDREKCIDYANGEGRTPLPYADIESYLHDTFTDRERYEVAEWLDIVDKVLSVSDVAILARKLKYDEFFISCVLDSNGMSSQGAALIAESLCVNNTLQCFTIRNNAIGPAGAASIGNALTTNDTIEDALNLVNTDIGDEGAAHIGAMLRTNTALNAIDLSRNHIGDAGVTSLADALLVNNTLSMLLLCHNTIGSRGITSIARMLRVNTTLYDLSLDDSNIGPHEAGILADALLTNTALGSISLNSNPLGTAGLASIAMALRTNTTVTVTVRDVGVVKDTAIVLGNLVNISGRKRLITGW